LLCPFPVNYDIEKFLKKLAGRSDVEDALQQLDTLTKEETSMTVARTLEVTHHVDDNVEEMKMLTKSAGDDIKAIQGVASSIDYNVKATKDGMLPSCPSFLHVLTIFACVKLPTRSNVCRFLTLPIVVRQR
jgi:hypothetical protein